MTTRVLIQSSDLMARVRERCFKTGENGTVRFDFNTLIERPTGYEEIEDGTDLIYGRALIGYPEENFLGVQSLEAMLGPPWVRLAGITTVEDLRAYLLQKYPNAMPMAAKALALYTKHGAWSLYDWSIEHWGTKWNAYDLEWAETQEGAWFRFDTAWSVPVPVLEALAAAFPELEFQTASFDEMWNFGHIGIGLKGSYAGRDIDATGDLYRMVHGQDPDEDEGENAVETLGDARQA